MRKPTTLGTVTIQCLVFFALQKKTVILFDMSYHCLYSGFSTSLMVLAQYYLIQ